jgi:hypothetical protein
MWKIMGNSDIAMLNSLAGAATWQSQAQTPSRPPLHLLESESRPDEMETSNAWS